MAAVPPPNNCAAAIRPWPVPWSRARPGHPQRGRGVHRAGPDLLVIAPLRPVPGARGDGLHDQRRGQRRIHRLDQRGHPSGQGAGRARAADQPVLPVSAFRGHAHPGGRHLDRQVVAGEPGGLAVLRHRADPEHPGVVGGEGVGGVSVLAAGHAAGVARGRDHHDPLGQGGGDRGTDRPAGTLVPQGHADDTDAFFRRILDGVGEVPLHPGLRFVLVAAVLGIPLIGDRADGEDLRGGRHPHDPAGPVGGVPVPGDERRHPGAVHAPVRVRRRRVHTGEVTSRHDGAGEVGDGTVHPAVDQGNGHPGAVRVLPRTGHVDRVKHPKLLLPYGVGLRRTRGADGEGRRRQQRGQHRRQRTPLPGAGSRPQHPGLPGQCGTGGAAPRRDTTEWVTPDARPRISSPV